MRQREHGPSRAGHVLGMTGTKFGCGMPLCGACIDGSLWGKSSPVEPNAHHRLPKIKWTTEVVIREALFELSDLPWDAARPRNMATGKR
jgi:hypothetical protein